MANRTLQRRSLATLSAGSLAVSLWSFGPVLSTVGSGVARGRSREALLGAMVVLLPSAAGAIVSALLAFRRADALRRRQLALLMAAVATPVGAALLMHGAEVAPERGMRSAAVDPALIQRSARQRRCRKRAGRGPLSTTSAAADPPHRTPEERHLGRSAVRP